MNNPIFARVLAVHMRTAEPARLRMGKAARLADADLALAAG